MFERRFVDVVEEFLQAFQSLIISIYSPVFLETNDRYIPSLLNAFVYIVAQRSKAKITLLLFVRVSSKTLPDFGKKTGQNEKRYSNYEPLNL